MRCAKEYEADPELFRATHLTKKKKVPTRKEWQTAVYKQETEKGYAEWCNEVITA
jgi:hypothetical protein